MKLTRVKRKELKTGDLYCETVGMFQCPVFVQTYPGDTEQPTSLQQLDVLRINPPDSAHRVDELLASTKQAYESLHQRYDECRDDLQRKIQNCAEGVKTRQSMIHDRDVRIAQMNAGLVEMWRLAQIWYVEDNRGTITSHDRMHEQYRMLCKTEVANVFGDDLTIEIDRDHVVRPLHQDRICRHAADLEQLDLMDDILKIVNTTVHHKMKSPHRKNDAFDAERMQEVCDVVAKFRRDHNIVG